MLFDPLTVAPTTNANEVRALAKTVQAKKKRMWNPGRVVMANLPENRKLPSAAISVDPPGHVAITYLYSFYPAHREIPSVKGFEIIAAACRAFQISTAELFSKRRIREVVERRQAMWYLMKKHTRLSFPDIGARTGGFDHTTVLCGVRKFDAAMQAESAAHIALARAIERELR